MKGYRHVMAEEAKVATMLIKAPTPSTLQFSLYKDKAYILGWNDLRAILPNQRPSVIEMMLTGKVIIT